MYSACCFSISVCFLVNSSPCISFRDCWLWIRSRDCFPWSSARLSWLICVWYSLACNWALVSRSLTSINCCLNSFNFAELARCVDRASSLNRFLSSNSVCNSAIDAVNDSTCLFNSVWRAAAFVPSKSCNCRCSCSWRWCCSSNCCWIAASFFCIVVNCWCKSLTCVAFCWSFVITSASWRLSCFPCSSSSPSLTCIVFNCSFKTVLSCFFWSKPLRWVRFAPPVIEPPGFTTSPFNVTSFTRWLTARAIRVAASISLTIKVVPSKYWITLRLEASKVTKSLAIPIIPESFWACWSSRGSMDRARIVVCGKNVARPNRFWVKNRIPAFAAFSSFTMMFCSWLPSVVSIAWEYCWSTLIASATEPTIPCNWSRCFKISRTPW